VDTVRILHGLLAFASEKGEDRAVAFGVRFASDSTIDSVSPKAANGVMLKVCSRCFVLRILEAANAASASFALGSGAGEEMARSVIVILDSDIGFEERIDR
jgi:hypothetical protein